MQGFIAQEFGLIAQNNTDLGREVLELEMKRIERLYRNLQEVQTWAK